MLKIIQVAEEHISNVRELFQENLREIELIFSREFDISFDINVVLEQQMAKLQQYLPPSGRLLLAEYEGKIIGCAGLKKISQNVGEVKRMYVRPEYRTKGIGRSLLQAIIYEARQIGYSKIRLDSAPFAKSAQSLYYSTGFQNIEPYPESEIPKEYHSRWVFMELVL